VARLVPGRLSRALACRGRFALRMGKKALVCRCYFALGVGARRKT
jgi:hypothetical protein